MLQINVHLHPKLKLLNSTLYCKMYIYIYILGGNSESVNVLSIGVNDVWFHFKIKQTTYMDKTAKSRSVAFVGDVLKIMLFITYPFFVPQNHIWDFNAILTTELEKVSKCISEIWLEYFKCESVQTTKHISSIYFLPWMLYYKVEKEFDRLSFAIID